MTPASEKKIVSVTAKECRSPAVTAPAPSTQLSAASEARKLPLSCVAPLHNIALYCAQPIRHVMLLLFCIIC
ncbi:hypothetical protein T12_6845 [Trichinella patagoniensis]|uniref:Uncharacterized protein n=1 Tax=Trichinella patagoniensis TaxID=990121 RepID=A0A0V0Z0M1_9BILA|nr:hypothetical protein T12_6845 [Trichinella patagoniensis]